MKTMHGAFFLACSNMSRTRLAPTPTNISTKSEPEMVKNGTSRLAGDGAGEQRLAGAGRADQQRALGDLAAELGEALVGSFRNSTISSSSSRASSMPATSSKVTRPCFSVSSLALDLPKPIAPEPPPFCTWRSAKKAMPRISRNGSDW